MPSPEVRRSVLVTGAAGFIGSHVASTLLRRGDAVVGIDNFDDFYDPAIKRRNAGDLAKFDGFRLVEADIRDEEAVRDAALGCHAVIHLAARAGVRASLLDPVGYADVNVRGTSIVLAQAHAAGVPLAVLASSSSVYGSRTTAPFREDDPCDAPISPYASTKRAMERLAEEHQADTGMAVTCLRFFTAYGPRQRPEMAVYAFLDALRRGEPLRVLGDGSARRDFTYIDDIVDGVLRALDRAEGFRIYNLGDSRTCSVMELIDALRARLGVEAEIRHEESSPGDVPLTCAAIDRAREELGWEPKIDLEEGLRRTVEWFEGVPAA